MSQGFARKRRLSISDQYEIPSDQILPSKKRKRMIFSPPTDEETDKRVPFLSDVPISQPCENLDNRNLVASPIPLTPPKSPKFSDYSSMNTVLHNAFMQSRLHKSGEGQEIDHDNHLAKSTNTSLSWVSERVQVERNYAATNAILATRPIARNHEEYLNTQYQ